jgi:hypothetical protein
VQITGPHTLHHIRLYLDSCELCNLSGAGVSQVGARFDRIQDITYVLLCDKTPLAGTVASRLRPQQLMCLVGFLRNPFLFHRSCKSVRPNLYIHQGPEDWGLRVALGDQGEGLLQPPKLGKRATGQ